MSDAAYYRTEAERMLAWASNSRNAETVRRWRRLAEDYLVLADALEAKDEGRSPFFGHRMQEQQLQQQQRRLETDGSGVTPPRFSGGR